MRDIALTWDSTTLLAPAKPVKSIHVKVRE